MRSGGAILKRSNTTDRPMRCRPTRYGLYMNYADFVGTDTGQVAHTYLPGTTGNDCHPSDKITPKSKGTALQQKELSNCCNLHAC